VLLVRANSTECEAAVVKILTGCRNADPRPHVWTQADEVNRGLVDFVAKGMEKNATWRPRPNRLRKLLIQQIVPGSKQLSASLV
jgi:hypothetical protein